MYSFMIKVNVKHKKASNVHYASIMDVKPTNDVKTDSGLSSSNSSLAVGRLLKFSVAFWLTVIQSSFVFALIIIFQFAQGGLVML